VNPLQTTLDQRRCGFEAVQQAPPAGAPGGSVRDSGIVLLPTPTPRGIFRPGTGQ
jgi:hypothetical protein